MREVCDTTGVFGENNSPIIAMITIDQLDGSCQVDNTTIGDREFRHIDLSNGASRVFANALDGSQI